MKLVKKLLPFMVILVLFNCTQDDIDFEQEQKQTTFKDYLSAKTKKYTFYELDNLPIPKEEMPEAIYFDTFEEAEHFLNSVGEVQKFNFKNDGGYPDPVDTEDDPDQADDTSSGGGPGTYHDSFHIGSGVWMNIVFNVSGCQGSSISSYITGFTLGMSYYHKRGYLRTSDDNNGIDYSVRGVLHYNIYVDGIGTFITQNLSYGGSMSCNYY